MPCKEKGLGAGDAEALPIDQLSGSINPETKPSSVEAQHPSTSDFPVRWICDGRSCVGRIFAAGSRFRSVLDDDTRLGVFATVKEARAAILEAEAERFLQRAARRRRAA